ncbi:MAG: hypothetical protein P8N31_11520 [Planctomycetota bacterium]|nr:hypothetical protein [Planctomycetota bacterium]MDG2144177.1 hypothetical protein [Planctomycetota bacterium]
MKLRSLVFGIALSLSVLPLVSTVHMFRDWSANRAGLNEDEQLRQLMLPWCRPSFTAFLDPLRKVIPEDAAILCTPAWGMETAGKARWYLFLANALYPRRVFVREPALASGTLVTYPLWVKHHLETIDTDESGLSMAGLIKRTRLEKVVKEEIVKRDIAWEFRYALDAKDPFRGAELLHNDVPVDYLQEYR